MVGLLRGEITMTRMMLMLMLMLRVRQDHMGEMGKWA